uniref:Ring finger protein, transmembrane 1 n=1 Tax=Equus asinus TaxID=9793 RepID=A0A8C4L304_EQUAS
MQANCSQLHSPPGAAGSEDASASQCAHTRLTEGSCLHSGDVHLQINSIPKECAENPGSRNIRSGVHSRTHGCVHSRLRSHSHNEARQPDETATESGDHGSSSVSEFRYLFKWLQKSLPYILILSVKLVMQHITGKVLKDSVCLVTGILSRIFCSFILHLSFSVTLSQLNFFESYFGPFELLGSTLDCWNYRLHSQIPLHGLKMPYFIGAFFHHAF